MRGVCHRACRRQDPAAYRAPWKTRQSWPLLLQRLDGLIANQRPDLVDFVDEYLAAMDLRIVLVEACVDNRLDASGSCGHQGDPLGEINGFVHVMGDEDHGLARLFPNGEQL